MHSSLRAVRNCGHKSLPGEKRIEGNITTYEDGTYRVTLGNVMWCNSPWACPDCSRNIGYRKARYLSQISEAWHNQGGQIALITLTMRHDASMSLADIMIACSQPNSLQGLDRKYGSMLWAKQKTLPNARAAEITHGKNGWHYHLHYLVFLPGWVDAAELSTIRHRMWVKWSDTIANHGFDCDEEQSDARFIMRDEGIGQYLIKAGLEVAAGNTKHGRKGNMTPYQMLGRIIDHMYGPVDHPEQACPRRRHDRTPCPDYIKYRDLWHEYETATKGKNQLILPTRLGDWLQISRDELNHHVEAALQDELGNDIIRACTL
jgi:hypothetical protein